MLALVLLNKSTRLFPTYFCLLSPFAPRKCATRRTFAERKATIVDERGPSLVFQRECRCSSEELTVSM